MFRLILFQYETILDFKYQLHMNKELPKCVTVVSQLEQMELSMRSCVPTFLLSEILLANSYSILMKEILKKNFTCGLFKLTESFVSTQPFSTNTEHDERDAPSVCKGLIGKCEQSDTRNHTV